MLKQLFYYFYIDSYEFYEVYKIHLECIKTYINVFDKINIILSLDDINNTHLSDIWKDYIKAYLSLDNINFIIIQNNPKHREGAYFYNSILCQFDNFDGLILWMHGKRDFAYDPINVYNWICAIHYLNSFNINQIENVLLDKNNDYCVSGPLLEKYNINSNTLIYEGGMYWINPKKFMKLKTKEINDYIYFLWFISNVNDVFDHELMFCGENWTMHCLNINNMYHFQKSLIDNIHFTTTSGIICSRYDLLINNIEVIKEYFDEKVFNEMMDYSNTIINKVTNKL